jgi:hypothetical protein
VVLVIIAILAAIAVPALTGYIDKARDKSEISKARDHMVAIRTVLVECYAEGKIDSDLLGTTEYSDATVWELSGFDGFFDKVNTLLGEGPWVSWGDPGSWNIVIVGSSGEAVTEADGFMMLFAPDGISQDSDANIIVVTYKVSPVSMSGDSFSDFLIAYSSPHYDPNAGYEVYNLVNRPE